MAEEKKTTATKPKEQPPVKPKVQKAMVVGNNGNAYTLSNQGVRVTSARSVEVIYDQQVKDACKANIIKLVRLLK